jgi:hypothetical protein
MITYTHTGKVLVEPVDPVNQKALAKALTPPRTLLTFFQKAAPIKAGDSDINNASNGPNSSSSSSSKTAPMNKAAAQEVVKDENSNDGLSMSGGSSVNTPGASNVVKSAEVGVGDDILSPPPAKRKADACEYACM